MTVMNRRCLNHKFPRLISNIRVLTSNVCARVRRFIGFLLVLTYIRTNTYTDAHNQTMCHVLDKYLEIEVPVAISVTKELIKYTVPSPFVPKSTTKFSGYSFENGVYVRQLFFCNIKLVKCRDTVMTIVCADANHETVFRFSRVNVLKGLVRVFNAYSDIIQVVDDDLMHVIGPNKFTQIDNQYAEWNMERHLYYLNTRYFYNTPQLVESGILLCCKHYRKDYELAQQQQQQRFLLPHNSISLKQSAGCLISLNTDPSPRSIF